MKAQKLTRNTFDLGGETHNYSTLRKYVCDACGGQVTHRIVWDDDLEKSVDTVACARCGGEDIISEYQYEKQISDGLELKQGQLYQQHMRQARKEGRMPLKDIEPQARLKRIETIRLGWTEPTGGNYERPVAADHFVLTDAPTLDAIYPEPPKSLPIYFPHRTFDENVMASYGVWVGGSKDKEGKHRGGFRVCQGDGECVQSALPFKTHTDDKGRVHVNRAPGDRLVSWGNAARDFEWDGHQFHEGGIVPCPGRKRGLYTHCEACNPSIVIKVRIRDDRVARFGYWQISTQSINNYLHLMSVWDDLTLQMDGSRLPLPMSEVPFVLSIEPGSTLYQNQKDQMWGTREAFFIKLELDPTIAKLEQAYRERRIVALLSGRSMNEPMVLLPPETDGDLPFDAPPIDGEYDESLVEDDPFLEGEFEDPEPEPVGPVASVPLPEGLTHKNIVTLAVQHLDGYKNVGQVKGAIFAIVQDSQWEKSTEWSYSDVWFQLQDHARAPKDD